MSFTDRREAGLRLARAVAEAFADVPDLDPVVLALPRGGVPVALEIARTLGAPLDLVMVRKIGVPGHEELAAAAVVDGDVPQRVVNADVVARARIDEATLAEGERRALAEIARRRATYLGGRPRVPVAGRDAIVVDDGIATGATMRAALRGVRQQGPRSLTLAVPLAPDETLAALGAEVNRVICLETPAPFFAIGAHYRDFPQLEDADVVAMLREASAFAGTRPAGGPGA
jgi:putative phosphoribosyl transferase